MTTAPNQSVEPTGGSRCAQIAFVSQWRLPPVAHAWRWAAMRVLLPFLCILFAGCAAFFSEGERELGIIQSQPNTNVVVRAVLPRDARYIKFTCATPIEGVQGGERVTVTLTNTSSTTIEVGGPGAVSSLTPHTSAQLFDGGLSALVGDRRFAVSTWSGGASCELHIRFVSAPNLPAPIRILCWRSSPPL
jgi:hypothetical protein